MGYAFFASQLKVLRNASNFCGRRNRVDGAAARPCRVGLLAAAALLEPAVQPHYVGRDHEHGHGGGPLCGYGMNQAQIRHRDRAGEFQAKERKIK